MLDTMKEPDSELAEAVRRWVDDLAQREGVTITKIAKRSGVPQSSLSRIKNGEVKNPTPGTVARLAATYPTGIPPAIRAFLEQHDMPSGGFLPSPIVAPAHEAIPVWGVHPIARTAEFHLNAHAVATLRRPPGLLATRHLIAFYAPDDTMSPRWHAGEPVVVDLTRPAAIGQYALVRLSHPSDQNGDEVYVFRRLLRRGDGHLWVTTDDRDAPPEGIPLQRVLEPRRVLDWADLLT